MTDPEKQETETVQSSTELSRFGFLTYPAKIIVFPIRALRELIHAQRPKTLLPGFLVVLLLNMAVTAGAIYVRASKIYLDSGTESTRLLGADFIGTILFPTLLQSLLGLVLNWITYAGVLFLIARFLGKKNIPLNVFLMVVGYAFSVLVIYGAITALLVSFLPEIHFETAIWESGTAEEVNNIFNSVWGATLAYRLMDYSGLVFMFWLVFLGAMIVRISQEISLITTIAISFTAYFASSVLTAFISLL